MADKVDVKTLGHSGVIIDQNPLEPSLPDDSLRSAQNATHDPTEGFGGALRKRPGLRRFNLAWAGGPILGGIPMVVAGTGGAPVPSETPGVNDPTGSAVGSGDGTGAPGATFDGGSATFGPAGAGQFNGGSSLFGGARLIVLGRNNNQSANLHAGGVGWYVTSQKIANAANLVTTPGPPGAFAVYSTYSSIGTGPFYVEPIGKPFVYEPASGYYFYAGAHDQTGNTAPTIRKNNGGTDTLVATIINKGANTGGAFGASGGSSAIMDMIVGDDGNIYITVIDVKLWDQITSAPAFQTTNSTGRMFQLVPSTGQLTEMNLGLAQSTTPATYGAWPYLMAYFQGVVYFSTWDLTGSANNNRNLHQDVSSPPKYVGGLANLLTTGTYSDNAGAGLNVEALTAMIVFPAAVERPNDQLLFYGGARHQAVPTLADIGVKARNGPTSSTALSIATPPTLAADAGAAADGNYWSDFCEFNGNLYAAFYNPNGGAFRSLIYRYVPNYANVAGDGGWDGTGTWTLVMDKHLTNSAMPYRLYVDAGVMYVVGYTGFSNGANPNLHNLFWTTDGTNYTDVTSNVPQSPNSAFAQPPILMGFNQ